MTELTKDDEYSMISKTMLNIRSLRAYAREVAFEQLVEMQEKLNAVIEERREDAEREAAEREEREKKRQELIQLIQSEGFDLTELVTGSSDISTRTKKLGKKAPPKYQFEENGETKYWSGRGRAPKPIDEALKAGRSLNEFLIEK
ncbi:H-NS family nucleoid-associated regulatory protein [Citrobacter sp. S2-9]|uniref:DNA-binding protein n=1 Tax=Citrobacter enshiensis TaxID=2971264 RepID=A0ABT8Q1U5_9ENTR|nr:H-NS family nucleoid-associated regulatory protein [Citrobacter enshiensis]MDN8602267.1 H-NS family nucleoid-associated regulatory protein [Citrobacter enshiensis]